MVKSLSRTNLYSLLSDGVPMKINNKLTLAACFALSISACSQNMTVEQYLAQAKEFSEMRDHNSAIISLKNAARLDAKNANVRYSLGAAYLAQGDYFSAEKELEKAEKLGSDNELLIANLVQAKVKLNKFDYVYHVVNELESVEDEEAIIILTYAGMAALYEGKREAAQNYVDQAIEISHDSVYGKIGKAYLTQSQKGVYEALEIVNDILLTSPDFSDAYLLKGHLLQADSQYKQAAKSFEKYLEYRPKEVQTFFFIAQNYIADKQFKKAEPIVDKLLTLSKYNPLANQMKAQIEFSEKNYQLALEYGSTSYQQNEQMFSAIIIAGMSAYNLEDFELAYHNLRKVKNNLPASHFVNKLLIELQLRLGYETEAVGAINALVDSGDADVSLLTSASQEMLKSGSVAAAQELLNASIQLNTDNPEELTKQGIMKLRLNELGVGIEFLEKALSLEPNLSAAEESLVVGYLENNQLVKALEFAKKWQMMEAKKIQGYLLESQILDKQNEIVQAKSLLLKIVELDANNVTALYKLAYYAHKNGQVVDAFDYYSKVLTIKPEYIKAIVNFTKLITTESELNKKAIQFYQTRIEGNSSNNYAKLGLAYIYKMTGGYQSAMTLFKEIMLSSSPIEGVEIALGDLYVELKDWQNAINTYEDFARKKPDNLLAGRKLLMVYEQTKQIDNALAQVNKMAAYHLNNVGLDLFKAYFQSLLREKPTEGELSKLKNSKSISEHWLLNKTLGNLAYNQKDFVTSSNQYKKAYDKYASSTNITNWSKSVALLGRMDKSITLLEKHLHDNNTDIPAKIMLAGAYLNSTQHEKARVLYREIVSKGSKHVIALNNLAYLEMKSGNVSDALTYGYQAIELAPQNSAVLDTYAQILVLNKDVDGALVIYDRALKNTPENVEIKIHKAQALIASAQQTLAKKLLLPITNASAAEKDQITAILATLK